MYNYRTVANMYTAHPLMFQKKCTKIPRPIIRDLKKIHELSSKKSWEYAGAVKCKIGPTTVKFDKPSFVTSKNRRRMESDAIKTVWPSLITYHTHPHILAVPLKDSDSEDVFVTLPSNADLKVYISEFPAMQTNIICDSYGYYIIDIIDAAEQNKSPLPAGAKRIMTEFRQRPDIQKRVFSEGGLEYYRTTLKEWKHFINKELNPYFKRVMGITIRYYGYDDEPPYICFDMDQIVNTK